MEHLVKVFTLDSAIALAAERHRNQKDKEGKPYFEHLEAVANQLVGDQNKMAGFLHDIVEDTPTTFDELIALGCPEPVVGAIRLVTHENQSPSPEEYSRDIQKIADSRNQIAIDVKWADLTNNSDMSRIPNPTQRDFNRWEKYKKAKEVLRPFVSGYLLNR